MTEEEREVALVYKALNSLHQARPVWRKNLGLFFNMNTMQRLRWWRHVKQQAEAGNPAMQQLVLEVITLRMTS